MLRQLLSWSCCEAPGHEQTINICFNNLSDGHAVRHLLMNRSSKYASTTSHPYAKLTWNILCMRAPLPPNYSKLNRAGSGIIGSYSICGPRATLNNWGGYSMLISHRLVVCIVLLEAFPCRKGGCQDQEAIYKHPTTVSSALL